MYLKSYFLSRDRNLQCTSSRKDKLCYANLLHTTIRTDVKTMEHGFSQHPSLPIGRPLKCVTVMKVAVFTIFLSFLVSAAKVLYDCEINVRISHFARKDNDFCVTCSKNKKESGVDGCKRTQKVLSASDTGDLANFFDQIDFF